MIPVPLSTLESRKRFHADVERAYAQLEPGVNPKAACLYWSIATLIAAGWWRLTEYGWAVQMQGGTASFIRLAPEDDDGAETTHNSFGYVFEDSLATRRAIIEDRLPEMHCWVACAGHGVLFDHTTGFLPDQCRETAGLAWTAPPPPPFLIFRADDPPPGCLYIPSVQGTHLVHTYAARFMDQRRRRA